MFEVKQMLVSFSRGRGGTGTVIYYSSQIGIYCKFQFGRSSNLLFLRGIVRSLNFDPSQEQENIMKKLGQMQDAYKEEVLKAEKQGLPIRVERRRCGRLFIPFFTVERPPLISIPRDLQEDPLRAAAFLQERQAMVSGGSE